MKLPEHYINMRHKLFQNALPVKDWRVVIQFEKIVINYIEMHRILKKKE